MQPWHFTHMCLLCFRYENVRSESRRCCEQQHDLDRSRKAAPCIRPNHSVASSESRSEVWRWSTSVSRWWSGAASRCPLQAVTWVGVLCYGRRCGKTRGRIHEIDWIEFVARPEVAAFVHETQSTGDQVEERRENGENPFSSNWISWTSHRKFLIAMTPGFRIKQNVSLFERSVLSLRALLGKHVIVTFDTRHVFEKNGGSGRHHTTALIAISAAGQAISPFIVYAGRNLINTWCKGGPSGTRYYVTKKVREPGLRSRIILSRLIRVGSTLLHSNTGWMRCSFQLRRISSGLFFWSWMVIMPISISRWFKWWRRTKSSHVGFFIVPNAFLLRSNCVLNAIAEARLGAAKMKHLLHLNAVEERRQTRSHVASERVSAANASSRVSSNK